MMPLVGVGHHQAFILPQHLTILVSRPSPYNISTLIVATSVTDHQDLHGRVPGCVGHEENHQYRRGVRVSGPDWKWIMVVIFNQVKTIVVTNTQRWWVSIMNGNSWRVTNERDGGTHNSVTCDITTWTQRPTILCQIPRGHACLTSINRWRNVHSYFLDKLFWSSRFYIY